MTKVIEVEGIGKVEVEFSLKANREIQIKGKDVLVRMKEFPPQSTPGAGYIVAVCSSSPETAPSTSAMGQCRSSSRRP
jgi:hypothetical protein